MAAAFRTTVLLTGFGPFPRVRVNATMALVPHLNRVAAAAFPDVVFVTAILPTEWKAAPWMVDALYLREDPDVALHFGVASRARGFEIETRGRNACKDADAVGDVPESRELITGEEDFYLSAMPLTDIARRLTVRRIPVAISRDAGSYLCNAVLFHARRKAARYEALRHNGFIHIPDDLPVPGRPLRAAHRACQLSFDQAIQGGLEIIGACLGRQAPDLERVYARRAGLARLRPAVAANEINRL